MAHHFIHPTKYLELIVDGNVGLYMIGPASQNYKVGEAISSHISDGKVTTNYHQEHFL